MGFVDKLTGCSGHHLGESELTGEFRQRIQNPKETYGLESFSREYRIKRKCKHNNCSYCEYEWVTVENFMKPEKAVEITEEIFGVSE